MTSSTDWSALNEAFFTIDADPADSTNLVITELHYHPAEPTSPEEEAVSNDRDNYEFVELLALGDQAIDLGGVRFTAGIDFTFPELSILQPGERLLIAYEPTDLGYYGTDAATCVEQAARDIGLDGLQLGLQGLAGRLRLDGQLVAAAAGGAGLGGGVLVGV